MPWTYTDDYYREYTRTTWNESAARYVRFMRLLEPFGNDLLDRVAARPGESVIDIATGPGEPAMTLARIVGDGACVLGIDLSERMVELAGEVARARGLANVGFRVMDAEHMDLPPEAFDIATSRFGFQIFTNPEGVAREAHRVLRPGGRIGAAVWSTAERVPALDALVAAMLEFAEPDETGYLPTPYELGGPGEFGQFLEEAGFRDVEETRTNHVLHFDSEDDYLDQIMRSTPLGHSVGEEDPEVQEKVIRRTRENLQRWRANGGFLLPAECVIVTARK